MRHTGKLVCGRKALTGGGLFVTAAVKLMDEIMDQLKRNWFVAIIIIIFVAGAFYWCGLRPAIIRHNCSWVKRHQDVQLLVKGVSGEQDREECLKKYGSNLYGQYECGSDPQPAKDWWDKASKEEYDFCIHEKGL